jgi:N-acetylglucosaminyl-diphospho-decaprenol L-rhamnosyltransferase
MAQFRRIARVMLRGPSSRYRPLVRGDDLEPTDSCHDVSIVIVTHESSDDIVDCVGSIEPSVGRATYEVILVDNASEDGTADLVTDAFPWVRVIRKDRRHGFATNCNIGATAAAGRHLLFLNPDTTLTSGAIDALVDHLEANPGVGLVGPRLIFPDGSPQPSARRFPRPLATLIRRTPVRWLLPESEPERRHLMLDLDHPNDSVSVDWLLGAAIAVRTEAYWSIGGMDDNYRLYCEDIDLCWRLQEHRWRVELLPAAEVVHDLSELTRHRFITRATYWHYRSMARFIRKHGLGRPVPMVGPQSVSEQGVSEQSVSERRRV